MTTIAEEINLTKDESTAMLEIVEEKNISIHEFINKAVKEFIKNNEIPEFTYYCGQCAKEFDQDISWCDKCGGHIESNEPIYKL